MIISASRRTDIPAFFGEWFMNRIKDGYFISKNPFNPSMKKTCSLLPEDVDAIVFWSKYPEPFMKYLDLLDEKGYRYYFQYTLNDYPLEIEPNLPPAAERIKAFRELSGRLGPRKVLWRYDPVIVSSKTPPEYHLEKINRLCEELDGCTCRLTVSFLDFYDKIAGRMSKLSESMGTNFEDIASGENLQSLKKFAKEVSGICMRHGLEVYTCAEKVDLQPEGIRHGSCIDAVLINKLFGTAVKAQRDKNMRSGCMCAASTDMGAYNTCRFQCCYCYANYSEKSVLDNVRRHQAGNPEMI